LRPAVAAQAAQENAGAGEFLTVDQTLALNEDSNVPIYIYALPLHRNGEVVGTVALLHDASYIDKQVSRSMRDSLLNALFQTFLITGSR